VWTRPEAAIGLRAVLARNPHFLRKGNYEEVAVLPAALISVR